MAARRLIVAMIVLLVLSSVAAALVPVDSRTGDDTSTETETTAERPGPSGELHTETLRAGVGSGAAKPQRIAIELGDQLALKVTSPVAAQVEIPALGEIADVDPNAPARFDLLPFEAGQYAVRLVDEQRTVGVIVVEPRSRDSGSDQPGGSSTDSPGSSTTAFTAGARWLS